MFKPPQRPLTLKRSAPQITREYFVCVISKAPLTPFKVNRMKAIKELAELVG